MFFSTRNGRTRSDVMQKPVSLRLVAPFPPNCIEQPLQNLHVQMATNTLSRLYELVVHQTVDVKEILELLTATLYIDEVHKSSIFEENVGLWLLFLTLFTRRNILM
jgi:hypothetical protein